MNELNVKPIWSDSMGAKSMCVRVDTEDTSILIDPGAAVMQRSYPLDVNKKYKFLSDARRDIEESSFDVENIVITHYHYDHHFLPGTDGIDFDTVFSKDKKFWIKNPNEWINPSQWDRSRKFIKALLNSIQDSPKNDLIEDFEKEPKKRNYKDPLKDLPLLQQIEEGDYKDRREELHKKWRKKFFNRVDMWKSKKHLEEPADNIRFAEGNSFKEGKTKIRFTEPLFHGIEYSKTGWVFGVIIERKGEKFLYSSDLHGPTIEDYAQWIIDENPDFIILDGPATYHLGHLLNKFNLNRSATNASKIIEDCDFETMLYDHHLTRGKFFRDRTEKIWRTKDNLNKNVLSFREFIEDKMPLIEEITG